MVPYVSGWRYRALLISTLMAVVGYLVFSLWAGWGGVQQALGTVSLWGGLGLLLMSLGNYLLRFVRWQMYLRVLGHPMPWLWSLRIYLAGFALTTTPGKAGEALRSVLLKPWHIPYTQSMAALLSERLSDLLAILVLTLWGLSLYPEAQSMAVLGIIGVGLGLFVLIHPSLMGQLLRYLPTDGSRLFCWIRHGLSVIGAAQACHRLRILWKASVLSLLAWLLEAVALYWILHWMGAVQPLGFVVLVYALSVLAGVVSFMPGGLGGMEAVMTGLLLWKGVPEGATVATVILIRLVTLWFAVILGLGCLFSCRHTTDDAEAGILGVMHHRV